ncbi:endo alpha-1,4 polygalactosaminidase [Paenibacillus sp. CC-CFT747]|nr:endo alpha-1,4 polygalactosaminidase [Paenibacillus sp. CC-CFT747]
MTPRRLKTALLISSLLAALALGEGKTYGSGPFQQVNSYTIYYGEATPERMAQLKRKNLVIIEPHQFTAGQIQEIRKAGTLVIGYLSVMESPVWNQARMTKLQAGDYLLNNGQRIRFAEWNSYLMDLRSRHYRTVLLEEIRSSIAGKGLDGIFLDTVGDMDDRLTDQKVQTEIRQAYRGFLQETSAKFPALTLIQNRGFDTLPYSLPYLDGFLWEDWRSTWKQNVWMKQRVQQLQLAQQGGLKVFSVSTRKDAGAAKAASQLNYVHLDAAGGYLNKIN